MGGSSNDNGYVYDKVGNRLQMLNYQASSLITTTSYNYDEADRLTSMQIPRTVFGLNKNDNYSYQYDENGSLSIEKLLPANNQPVTNRYTTTYKLDSRNRLATWEKKNHQGSTDSASYVYNGSNTRLAMTYNGTTTSYLQDIGSGLAVVLEESVVGGYGSKDYMYPQGSTTPLYQMNESDRGLWYHADGLGSIRLLTYNGQVYTRQHAHLKCIQ